MLRTAIYSALALGMALAHPAVATAQSAAASQTMPGSVPPMVPSGDPMPATQMPATQMPGMPATGSSAPQSPAPAYPGPVNANQGNGSPPPPPSAAGRQAYPPCTAQVQDSCTQVARPHRMKHR